MDGEMMQKNLEDILSGDGMSSAGRNKDFEITKDEAKKFKAAMADPEFQSMLKDYMEEMQDPKLRAEQEAYISQLESQQRVPKGKEVVHPMPGFVIKTRFWRAGKEDERQKLFVNVVTSPKIAPPTSSRSTKGGAGGEMWSLPHAVGPVRMEKDKAGENTTTFDACFHPEALVRAKRLDAFRNLVSTSSLEAVEQHYAKAMGNKIVIEKKFRVLVGVPYKSGTCATMLVAKEDVHEEPSSSLEQQQSAVEDAGAKPVAPPAEAKIPEGGRQNEYKSKADKQSSSPQDQSAKTASPAQPVAQAEAKLDAVGDGSPASPSAVTAPPTPPPKPLVLGKGEKRGRGGAKYKLVESGAFEISDHTQDRVSPADSRLPQRLVVTVTLPADVEPTRKLDVLVDPRRLMIGVAGDPEDGLPRYLDLSLPYAVEDESKCTAKRDKTGVLTIMMPVQKPSARPPPPSAGELESKVTPPPPPENNSAGYDDSTDEDEVANWQLKQHNAPSKSDHSRWVQQDQSGPKFEFTDAEMDLVRASNESLVKKMDDFVAAGESFIPCTRFMKSVPGYVFTNGDEGPGYYREEGKQPSIEWNETVTTIVGVVNVPGIVEDSVRMNFRHESSGSLPEADSLLALELTFVAKSAKNSDDDAAAVDRGIFYSTVLNIPGGIDPQRCTHKCASMNLIVKLAKDPMRDWVSFPFADPKQSQQEDNDNNDEDEDEQDKPQGDDANRSNSNNSRSRATVDALLKPSSRYLSSSERVDGGKRDPAAPGHGSGVQVAGEINSADIDGVPKLVYELD